MRLKEFVPPILINTLSSLKDRKSKKVFSSYDEAMRHCSSNAYENTELCNMIADKTAIYIKELARLPFKMNSLHAFALSALAKHIITYSKDELCVLDFGGACGAHYYEIKQLLPNVSFNWIVVETQQIVKSALERDLNNTELSFVANLEEIKHPVDIIHTSGALQYVPDPFAFLEKLIDQGAGSIFFNRMMFTHGSSNIVTVQSSLLSDNGPGKLPSHYKDRIISYPHTTISYDKFNQILINRGYKLNWSFEETSGIYKKDSDVFGRGLLYTK